MNIKPYRVFLLAELPIVVNFSIRKKIQIHINTFSERNLKSGTWNLEPETGAGNMGQEAWGRETRIGTQLETLNLKPETPLVAQLFEPTGIEPYKYKKK